ncbi:hypothetical protein ACFQL1_12805 [Halomicroarcula sp. GCM10025709]|uniref:DUF7573 domain-containing protein n=1 Tax=Haloarcula TaxID=2237 RepID=UPI0024C31BFB|nr:hypothetical protein [Halomicroarcula sp. YJ-61-S]
MAEDASLDEFLDGEDDDTVESAADEEPADTDPADEVSAGGESVETDSTSEGVAESEDSSGVEPATTTYAWTGDGAVCSACDEVVERRWEQDGALVCSACKAW